MAKVSWKNGITSVILRVNIPDTTSVIGGGKTGLTFASSGLIIATIADNEASGTAYTQAGSTVETITTLGTFAAPTATKCRFKEVDPTNFPGLYEIQIADARWAVSGARSLIISLPPVSGLGTGPVRAEIQLTAVDPQDATRGGLTALPNASAGASGGIPVLDSNLSILANAILRGTASAGAANSITLTGGSATDNLYKYGLVQILSGTGAGQSRLIIDYVGSTKVATINKGWSTTPDNTSVFAVLPWTTPTVVHSGIAQAGGSTSITLQSVASASDNVYTQHVVTIFTGTGAFQSRIVTGYVGSTKVATVDSAWAVNPDSTSVYEISAVGPAWADVFQWNGTAVATPDTAGVPVINLKYVLGTLLTESVSGYLAAGFKKFFNVLNGTATILNLPLNTDYTSARATKLDNLDAAISAVPAAVLAYAASAVTTAGSWAEYVADTLASVLLKTNLIGSGTMTVTSPVGPDGRTLNFVRNDDYVVANGRQVDLTLPAGFPDMVLDQDLTLGYKKFDGSTGILIGTAYTTRIMRFEFPASVTNILIANASDYSVLEVVSATRNTPYVGLIVVTDTRTSAA